MRGLQEKKGERTKIALFGAAVDDFLLFFFGFVALKHAKAVVRFVGGWCMKTDQRKVIDDDCFLVPKRDLETGSTHPHLEEVKLDIWKRVPDRSRAIGVSATAELEGIALTRPPEIDRA